MQNYKVKIEAPNILENVSEAFDGVLNLMTPNSIISGKALCEIVAGFDSHEVLDIIVSRNEAKTLITSLKTSTKWVEKFIIEDYKQIAKIKENEVVGVALPHITIDSSPPESGGFKTMSKNPYAMMSSSKSIDPNRGPSYEKYANNKHIDYFNSETVRTFVNTLDQKLQIIAYKTDNQFVADFEKITPTDIANKAEFICYGLIMDVEGMLYEVIEGAKSDCLKRIVRINPDGNIRIDSLNNKINKLVQQGWTTEINISKVKQDIFRKKRNLDRKLAKRNSIKTKINDDLGITFTRYVSSFDKFRFNICISNRYFSSKNEHLNNEIAINLFYTIINNAYIHLPNRLDITCSQSRSKLKLRLLVPKEAEEVTKKIKDAFIAHFSKKCNLEVDRIPEGKSIGKTSAKKQASAAKPLYFTFDSTVYKELPTDKQINKSSLLNYGRISTETEQDSSNNSSFSSYIVNDDSPFDFNNLYASLSNADIKKARTIEETDVQMHTISPEALLTTNGAPPLKPMKIKKQSGLTKDEYLVAAAKKLAAKKLNDKNLNGQVTGISFKEDKNFERFRSQRIEDIVRSQIIEDIVITKDRDLDDKEVTLLEKGHYE